MVKNICHQRSTFVIYTSSASEQKAKIDHMKILFYIFFIFMCIYCILLFCFGYLCNLNCISIYEYIDVPLKVSDKYSLRHMVESYYNYGTAYFQNHYPDGLHSWVTAEESYKYMVSGECSILISDKCSHDYLVHTNFPGKFDIRERGSLSPKHFKCIKGLNIVEHIMTYQACPISSTKCGVMVLLPYEHAYANFVGATTALEYKGSLDILDNNMAFVESMCSEEFEKPEPVDEKKIESALTQNDVLDRTSNCLNKNLFKQLMYWYVIFAVLVAAIIIYKVFKFRVCVMFLTIFITICISPYILRLGYEFYALLHLVEGSKLLPLDPKIVADYAKSIQHGDLTEVSTIHYDLRKMIETRHRLKYINVNGFDYVCIEGNRCHLDNFFKKFDYMVRLQDKGLLTLNGFPVYMEGDKFFVQVPYEFVYRIDQALLDAFNKELEEQNRFINVIKRHIMNMINRFRSGLVVRSRY